MFNRRLYFGKHKGCLLRDVPTSYLEWILREGTFDEDLLTDVDDELWNRTEAQYGGNANNSHEARPPAKWDEVLAKWHREMVLRFHPDRGGSHEAMKAINVAADRLRE